MTALVQTLRDWMVQFHELFHPRPVLRGDSRIRDGLMKCEEGIDSGELGIHTKGDAWVDEFGGGLVHDFGDGTYVREASVPKGMLFTTKIHKVAHPWFLLSGKLRILTDEGGVKILEGPCRGITPAGTKRLVYVAEDSVWCTVHATKHTSPERIEKDIIAKDFSEFKIEERDIYKIKGEIACH